MAESTSCWRSPSFEHAAKAALNASSLEAPCETAALNASAAALFPPSAALHWSDEALTQLRASAKEPVTMPHLDVSFAASARPSMGRPSPNWEYAPVRLVVSCSSWAWLSPHRANMLPAVSTERSVSPSTPMRPW